MSQHADDLNTLRADVAALTAQMTTLTEAVTALQAGPVPVPTPAPPGRGGGLSPARAAALWEATEAVAERAAARGVRGLATSEGCYRDTGEREYRWQREKAAEDLLMQDDAQVARVLAVLGNRQRLALLKAVLDAPGSATDLVKRADLTSSGQAYHHLNTLAAAGLIRSAERGQFMFVGHQAPAFLMLLMGVWHMLSSEYGTGTWSEDTATTAD